MSKKKIEVDDIGVEKHSINCYFCSRLANERKYTPADEWNDNDGGGICPECLEEKQEERRRDEKRGTIPGKEDVAN
jgi:hypothetical protein